MKKWLKGSETANSQSQIFGITLYVLNLLLGMSHVKIMPTEKKEIEYLTIAINYLGIQNSMKILKNDKFLYLFFRFSQEKVGYVCPQ